MRRVKQPAIFVFVFLLLAACEAIKDPSARWAANADALAKIQEQTVMSHKNGFLTDDQFRVYDSTIVPTRNALGVAETQLPAGGEIYMKWMRLAEEGMEQLYLLDSSGLVTPENVDSLPVSEEIP